MSLIAEHPRDGHERLRLEGAFLHAAVERVEQRRVRGSAEGDQLPVNHRAVGQPGEDVVDRRPPAVGGEVDAG